MRSLLGYRLIPALAAVAAVVTLLGAVGSAWSYPYVYSAGHADIGLGDAATLELHLHAHGGATINGVPLAADAEYAPTDALIRVPESTYNYIVSQGGRNASPAWDPIGVAAGQPYWFLPFSNSGPAGAAALGAPFLGIGAEHVDLGVFDGNKLYLRLIASGGTGPAAGGHFSAWIPGPDFYMATSDGISAADEIEVSVGGHDHYAFGFTKPGIYELTFEVRGTVGGSPVTDTATFHFEAVPEPGTLALLGTAGALVSLVAYRRRRSA